MRLKPLLFLFLITGFASCTTVHVHNHHHKVPPGHAKKHAKKNEVRYEVKEKKHGTEIKIKTR